MSVSDVETAAEVDPPLELVDLKPNEANLPLVAVELPLALCAAIFEVYSTDTESLFTTRFTIIPGSRYRGTGTGFQTC